MSIYSELDLDICKVIQNAGRSANDFGGQKFSKSNYIAVLVMGIDSKTGTSDWTSIKLISKYLTYHGLAACDANGSHLFGDRSGLGCYFDMDVEYAGNRKNKVRSLGWKKEKEEYRKEDLPKNLVAHYQNQECAHSGSKVHIEADHKHGRAPFPVEYSFDDVQALSRPYNAMKREHCKACEANDERFDARDFGYSAGWLISGISWKEAHEKYGQHGCVGCYWFDPMRFKELISINYSLKNLTNLIL